MAHKQHTTANVLQPQLVGNFELYIGTNIGSFKRLKIIQGEDGLGADANAHKLVSLCKNSDQVKKADITSLNWATKEHTEILIGGANNSLKRYAIAENKVVAHYPIDAGSHPVGATVLSDGTIVAGLSNGNVLIMDSKTPSQNQQRLTSGDNMARMRVCPTRTELVATGGRERQNNLKVWDLTSQVQVFCTKNVRPTELQLEVPIWDNDMSFLTDTTIATCSRHGYVRYYDTRTQRRPVHEFRSSDRDQFSFASMCTTGTLAYVGLTVGGIQCYDLRSLKGAIHRYKGAIGSVSDVAVSENGQYLLSSSLDRFVRIHSTQNNNILYQTYVKTKGTRLLCNEPGLLSAGESDSGAAQEEKQDLDELFENMPQVVETTDGPAKKRRKAA